MGKNNRKKKREAWVNTKNWLQEGKKKQILRKHAKKLAKRKKMQEDWAKSTAAIPTEQQLMSAADTASRQYNDHWGPQYREGQRGAYNPAVLANIRNKGMFN